LEQYSRNIESNAHLRAFRKSKLHLLEQVRTHLGYGPRFVAHPEILDVLLASPPSQPCVPEPAKVMPAHPRFVKLHRFEAFCKPTVFNVVVQVRRAVPGLKQQATLPHHSHETFCLGVPSPKAIGTAAAS
jgi:hypothetical protein